MSRPSNGKYKKLVTVGRDSSGKRIRKYFYASSGPDLEKKIREYFIEASKAANPSEIAFGDYAKKWLETYKAGKSPATYAMYERMTGKLSAIDKIRLRDVTVTDCQRIINDAWDHPRTAQLLRLTLKQIFERAIGDGIISVNPARILELPKRQVTEKRALTKKEVTAILATELPDPEWMFVRIMFTFGLRPGEAMALQKRQFDLEKKILTVDAAISHAGGKVTLKGTKTGKIRKIPIPDQLIPSLSDYLARLKTLLLFPMRGGQYMTKSSWRCFCDRIFSRINKKLGGDENIDVLNGMTMYTFRHNRATEFYYLCQKGTISTKKAAELMGHSEEVFLKVYSHVDEEKEDLSKIFEDLAI